MSTSPSAKAARLRLEMLSDWHVGTGAGIPGSIDDLLARDADGFPCVPAKTIVGVWRDSMETLTLGLDGGPDKPKRWQKWVDVIFGSQPNVDKVPTDRPRPSILSIQPARLDPDLQGAIGNDKRLRQALTFIKPNTAIDSLSGTAKSESLRLTEMGRIGTVLEAEFKLHFNLLENASPPQELIEALLVASAALVERIGGARRRGSGKCEWKADGLMTPTEAVQTIRAQTLPNIPSWRQPNNPAKAAQTSGGARWKKLPYSLKLLTPVAIVTNTLGNVSKSLDFVPGTYLLPHVTKQLNGISKYVAAGDFQLSPATISVNDRPGSPVPKIIHYHKVKGGFDEPKTVYNRLQEPIEGGEQKKNYREGYVSSLDETGTLPLYQTTRTTLLMHNTVDDAFQRPTAAVGGVFSRQAIKAGTTLRGEIRFKETIENQIATLVGYRSEVRIGTSKKDDYGLAKLELETIQSCDSTPSATEELIVYFESDTLLRNGNLRQTNLVGELRSLLEVKLSVTLTEKDSAIQVRRIESWHEGWGFPRPTLAAIAAGSVVAFTINDYHAFNDEQTQTLRALELSGIGERRGEGYGRIRFNPALLASKINAWTVLADTKENTIGTTNALDQLKAKTNEADKLRDFIFVIELAAWRDELARAVLKLANEKNQRKRIFGFDSDQGSPSMGQIGGLRAAVSRLMKPQDPHVIGWLEHLEATSNRLEEWDRNKDKQQAKKKLQEIKTLVEDESHVWQLLNQLDSTGRPYWNLSNEFITPHNNIQTTLWAEAVKSLFDACARAHKRDIEREEKKEAKANG